MKYVIFQVGSIYMPIVFPEHVTHSQVKIASIGGSKPVSAGFFTISHMGFVKTHGESESLKLKPHPRDADILSGIFLNQGTAFYLTSNYE